MTSFINWFIDSMASEDVIDLQFILTDMVDIYLTDEERCETAYYDSFASVTVNTHSSDNAATTGRTVW